MQLLAFILARETPAICVVLEYDNVPGGMEQQTVSMINELAQSKAFEVHLYVARSPAAFIQRFTVDPTVRIHQYDFEVQWLDLARYVQLHEIGLVFFPQLWEKTHYLLGASEFQYLRPKVKLVGQWHRDARQLVESDLATLHVLDRLVVLSSSGKEWLEKRFKGCKVDVIPNYVRDVPVQPRIRAGSSGKNVLFLGRYSEDKDPMTAIEVFEEALKTEPTATLTMAGPVANRKLFEKIVSYIERKHLTQIQLLLDQANVDALYSQADVLLMTSPREGFPLVVSEAHQCGLPVLMFNCQVENAQKGTVLVKQGDTGELLAQLLRLLANPQLAAQIGAEGKQFVKENFARASITSRWVELFTRLLRE